MTVLGGPMEGMPVVSAQMSNSAWVRSAIKPEYIEARMKSCLGYVIMLYVCMLRVEVGHEAG